MLRSLPNLWRAARTFCTCRTVNIHLINTLGVEDVASCIECRCPPELELKNGGGVLCCTDCPSQSTQGPIEYAMEYTTIYRSVSSHAECLRHHRPLDTTSAASKAVCFTPCEEDAKAVPHASACLILSLICPLHVPLAALPIFPVPSIGTPHTSCMWEQLPPSLCMCTQGHGPFPSIVTYQHTYL